MAKGILILWNYENEDKRFIKETFVLESEKDVEFFIKEVVLC